MIESFKIKDVAKAIGIPIKQWEGNCYAISCAMVKKVIVKGKAVYGHWTGPVSRSSVFYQTSQIGFVRHGWIVMPDESVVDPTRWVFEDAFPYIFVGEKPDHECLDFEPEDPEDSCCPVCVCGHVEEEHSNGFFRGCQFCTWPYDEGGNELRDDMRKPPPNFKAKEEIFEFDKYLSENGKVMLNSLFQGAKRKKGKLSHGQCFWLANLPYNDFGGMAREFYIALEKIGEDVLIPIDNQIKAKREG